MVTVVHGSMKKHNVCTLFRPAYLHLPFLARMHPKGSRFIGNSWVTQPFLLTRSILAKVDCSTPWKTYGIRWS
jgi:hypothetical protein